MPISKYFKGHGDAVMASMDKTYGPKKAKQVFYATANARGVNPEAAKTLSSPRKSAKVKS